jgi:hypothetical protein
MLRWAMRTVMLERRRRCQNARRRSRRLHNDWFVNYARTWQEHSDELRIMSRGFSAGSNVPRGLQSRWQGVSSSSRW